MAKTQNIGYPNGGLSGKFYIKPQRVVQSNASSSNQDEESIKAADFEIIQRDGLVDKKGSSKQMGTRS